MSISVSPNSDGSFTITCGAESVIVHPSATGQPGGSGTADPAQWPVFTPAGGGYSATIWAGKAGAAVKDHVIDSVDAISDAVARHGPERPALLRFAWAGSGPMPIGKLAEAARTSDPDRVRCEFRFSVDRT